MAKKRNPVACDPILRKGGAHLKSKSGQRHRRKDALLDEIEAYLEERANSPCSRRGSTRLQIPAGSPTRIRFLF